MAKTIELRRHTANDGDVLTDAGVQAALRIGATMHTHYDVVVSSGAQRSTQTAACFIAGAGARVAGGVVVDEGFRSEHEDRWREIYAATGKGDLASFLVADRSFVSEEAQRFAESLRRVARHTSDGGRSLVVGHSPMLEAAVWGVTEHAISALAKGEAVVLVCEDDEFSIAQ